MAKLSMSRRSFMKVAAATAAAAAVTAEVAGPLAALAQDDSAAASVGEVKKIRTCCRGCGKMECGIIVTVQNGRAIKIEGDPTSIQSEGNRCTKAIAALQAAYHPDRLLYPMKRTNPKGEDPGWVRISIDEAYQLTAKGMQEVMNKYGGESIAVMTGTSRIYPMAGYCGFQQLFQTPNHQSAWQICKGPRHFIGTMIDEYQYAWVETVNRPRVYVQWGASPEISNYDEAGREAVNAATFADCYINVNPRQSHLGKEADIWLPLRSGTDGAMALSWTNVVIENKLYDEKYVKRWTNAPFLVVEDMEPTEGITTLSALVETVPYTLKTRLLKESDLVEGGKPSRFMVWDTLASRLTYFDAELGVGTWEGETWAPQTKGRVPNQQHLYTGGVGQSQGFLPDISDFNPLIDPALEGEFEVTLKDGSTHKVKPVWEHYRALCAQYAPEKAAEITGVPAETIELAAKTYATRLDPESGYGNGGICYMLATEHGSNSGATCQALGLLAGITGNFDTPAGHRGHTQGGWYPFGEGGTGSLIHPPASYERVLGGQEGERPLLKWWKMWADAGNVWDAMNTGEPYPVKGCICQAGDFLNQANNTYAWEGLKQLDFFVDIDLWHHPTSEMADVIFPAQHFLEIPYMTRWSQGAGGGFGFMQRCIEPPGEAMFDIDFTIGLFKAMGVPWGVYPDDPWPSAAYEMVLTMPTAWVPPGPPTPEGMAVFEAKLAEFQENGWWDMKKVDPFAWGTYRRFEVGNQRRVRAKDANGIPKLEPGFSTPTMKQEIWSTIAETFLPGTGREMPKWEEPPSSPVSTPEMLEEYPLMCITGRRIPVYFHSEHRQLPWCREQWPVPRMEINPETAAKLGIKQGDWCWIESPHGKVRQIADLFYGIAPNAINAEHTWWYPEMPAPEHGWRYSAINQLVDNDSHDPMTGSSQLRAYLVKVYKAEEGAPEGIILSAADPRLKEWLPVYEGRA